TQADGRDRHGGAAQGTDSTTTIHTVDSLLLLFFVGASLLAKNVNDDAYSLNARGALRPFASKLAPTVKRCSV
ncbi:hypothetical protein FIV36_25425, partial [Pseudomonas extremaustralis]